MTKLGPDTNTRWYYNIGLEMESFEITSNHGKATPDGEESLLDWSSPSINAARILCLSREMKQDMEMRRTGSDENQ